MERFLRSVDQDLALQGCGTKEEASEVIPGGLREGAPLAEPWSWFGRERSQFGLSLSVFLEFSFRRGKRSQEAQSGDIGG